MKDEGFFFFVTEGLDEEGNPPVECEGPYDAVDLARKRQSEGRDPEIRVFFCDGGQSSHEDFPPPEVSEEEFLNVQVKVDRNEKDRTWKVSVSCQGVSKSDTFGSDSAAALYVAAAVQDLLNLG